jgi:hypothetical protein
MGTPGGDCVEAPVIGRTQANIRRYGEQLLDVMPGHGGSVGAYNGYSFVSGAKSFLERMKHF